MYACIINSEVQIEEEGDEREGKKAEQRKEKELSHEGDEPYFAENFKPKKQLTTLSPVGKKLTTAAAATTSMILFTLPLVPR